MKHHGNLHPAQPSTVDLKMPRCDEHDAKVTGTRKTHDMEAQIMKSKNISNSSAEVGGWDLNS